jgi:hypothetical protein
VKGRDGPRADIYLTAIRLTRRLPVARNLRVNNQPCYGQLMSIIASLLFLTALLAIAIVLHELVWRILSLFSVAKARLPQ